ncbi:MAG: FAD-dependent oxidoreductase [Candidatus Competibacteraceae bacterium]|nr:FAD-dependent oxidoreductase [Candidatus Competibacteraceae bacterium]MBK8898331.1 FAD-dependent oxidoreductase [Candidatus Competibacteraceae bacterium]MBK8962138.1 FAD-dependent oxidoreductase [Candidatus Competibacteraceae bacterium]MBK9951350.1 FAD-dependent oxidoreductase [Candidatus Competibacteraceae bacterium]
MNAPAVRESFDVIVVGAGPAGSTAALLCARAGLQVLLLERGEYPGAKNVSGAAFYGSAILNELIPNWWEQAPVERYICRRDIAFMSPTTSVALDFHCAGEGYTTPPYNGFIVLRPRFDRWLAAQAEAAGAFVLTSTVVDDVLRDDRGRVVGVRVRREQGEIHGKVVIACDGVNSFLAKKVGLQREFHAHELSLGVKEVLGLDAAIIEDRFRLSGDEGIAYEYLGAITEDVHGGAFLYTNRDSLSLGVIGQVSSLVERRKRPYELLERFKAHPAVAPLVRGAKLREYSAHLIPESGWTMKPTLYTDGMLVAGDAAGFCLAAGLYLEGMNYAMQSGLAAAETAIDACRQNRFSARALGAYRKNLKRRNVSTDFRAYRHAPAFVNSARLQNLYPEVVASGMEQLFRVDGNPKRKILPLARQMIRQYQIKPSDMLRDGYQMMRAYLW